MNFDIVLPTILRSSLHNTIDSVVNQTHHEWTLHIIQHGDYASDMMMQMWPDSRIRWHHIDKHGEDSGASARNFGISQGTSDWICYIDDDDEYLPNHLTTLVSLSTLNPEANMLRTAGQSFSWKHKSPRSSKLIKKFGAVNDTDILTVGMAHTRELLNRSSGWKPEDNHDKKLWNEMLSLGGKSAVTNQVTFQFER